ncbi:MAG: thioredoxin family protein [Promethearchaeota archaeon]|jgi:thioredoxin 1
MTNIEELQEFGLEISDIMKEGKVVLDVYTTWCGPCKFLSPILEKLEKEGLIKLLKEDLDKNRSLGERFNITAIPTLLFFKNGELLNHPIEVQGQLVVKNGMMVGAAGEQIMREIVSQM